MTLAVLSTLISSVASVGVAVSLLLQARQLRANQIQIAHASQLELMKLGLSNPSIIANLGFSVGADDADTFVKYIYLNWFVTHLSMSYDVKTVSNTHLRRLAEELFVTYDSRKWWTSVRSSYDDGATSRRQREFFAVVDGAFQRAESAGLNQSGMKPSSGPSGSSSPSS
jgi:Family of unknown function (DUF6082)